MQPRSHRTAPPDRSRPLCQDQESRLKCVLGLMPVADDRATDTQHHRAVPGHKRCKGEFSRLVALRCDVTRTARAALHRSAPRPRRNGIRLRDKKEWRIDRWPRRTPPTKTRDRWLLVVPSGCLINRFFFKMLLLLYGIRSFRTAERWRSGPPSVAFRRYKRWLSLGAARISGACRLVTPRTNGRR